MSAVLWAINRKCLLHKSRRLIRAAESMQSYLPARNAACAVSYANYATRSTSPDCLRVCVCVCGVSMTHSSACACVCVCVWWGNQAASRSAAIKARDPTKWKSNCIVAVSELRFPFLHFGGCYKKLFLSSKPLNRMHLLLCVSVGDLKISISNKFTKSLICNQNVSVAAFNLAWKVQNKTVSFHPFYLLDISGFG